MKSSQTLSAAHLRGPRRLHRRAQPGREGNEVSCSSDKFCSSCKINGPRKRNRASNLCCVPATSPAAGTHCLDRPLLKCKSGSTLISGASKSLKETLHGKHLPRAAHRAKASAAPRAEATTNEGSSRVPVGRREERREVPMPLQTQLPGVGHCLGRPPPQP